MTPLMERALEAIQDLSPSEQDFIASIILDEIEDEAVWNETMARSQDKLARMAALARLEIVQRAKA